MQFFTSCLALLLTTAFGEGFDLPMIAGIWKQVGGSSLTLNQNRLEIVQADSNHLTGTFTIVERRKTIRYEMNFRRHPDSHTWTMTAKRDGKATEWSSSTKNGRIYFTMQVTENGQPAFHRQGFFINPEGALLRSLEKSVDGENFQGIEEKYIHE